MVITISDLPTIVRRQGFRGIGIEGASGICAGTKRRIGVTRLFVQRQFLGNPSGFLLSRTGCSYVARRFLGPSIQ